jgi:hypothetical protein
MGPFPPGGKAARRRRIADSLKIASATKYSASQAPTAMAMSLQE